MTLTTICVASQKGGCGKSTFARHGSLILSEKTAVLDIDPQGTTLNWLEKRKERELSQPAAVISKYNKIGEVQKMAEDKGIKYLIIDTPPEHDDQRAIRSAIEHSDFVVIPTKMSPDDYLVAGDTTALCRDNEGNTHTPWMFVLSMTQPVNVLELARQHLGNFAAEVGGGKLCPHEIANRVAYIEAGYFHQGVTEFEPNGKAALEMRAVWWTVKAAVDAIKGAE